MNPKELFYLAGKCLSLDEHPEDKEEIVTFLKGNEQIINQLIFLCSNHFVLPVLYLKFKKRQLLHLFSKEAIEHLNYIYELNVKRNKEILTQIEEINQCLSSAQIEPVYLKGTGNLLDNLYSDVGERMIGDIDVLVKEKDYLKAAELIKKLGYKTDLKINNNSKKHRHYPRLYRKDVPADIEIHHKPVNIKNSRFFTSALLFENKKIVSDKKNCFVPCDKHKMIHSFIHSQLINKGHFYKITPLRDLYDYYLLSKRVEVNKVLFEIEKREKARAWFLFADYLFHSNNTTDIEETSMSRRYLNQYQWFMERPKFHNQCLGLIGFIRLIYTYIFLLGKSIFNKPTRIHILNLLKNRDKRKIHFDKLTDFFRSLR